MVMELESALGTATAGVLFFPADYFAPRHGLFALWRRHLVANASVRDRAYIEALFKSHFPNGVLVEATDGRVPGDALDRMDTIVLLFPDPIGMDFGAIERAVISRWPVKRLLALNGRRRLFRLDTRMRRRLGLRRFLASWRIPEFVFLLVFALTTPLLLLYDAIRGAR